MNTVQQILDSFFISNHKITANIPKIAEDRVKYLEMFEEGLYGVIVSIKVLDEGLNIPAVKNAIILASTGNPKQFIQRRGRVLRKYGGRYKDGTLKEYARIFDVFVIPDITESNGLEFYDLERAIVSKELQRYEDMIRWSRNPTIGLEQLDKIKRRFNL